MQHVSDIRHARYPMLQIPIPDGPLRLLCRTGSTTGSAWQFNRSIGRLWLADADHRTGRPQVGHRIGWWLGT